MSDLLVRDARPPVRDAGPPLSAPVDERAARTELRRQIGRLELQLSRLAARGFPRVAVGAGVGAASPTPRTLSLGALEQVRDRLAERVGEARDLLERREAEELRNRDLLERMLEDPSEFKWLRISRADVGEPGCGHWHSRPRLGLLGMLMGWWRVKVSSGCPL
jgi:hypothetical protein